MSVRCTTIRRFKVFAKGSETRIDQRLQQSKLAFLRHNEDAQRVLATTQAGEPLLPRLPIAWNTSTTATLP